MKRGLKRSPKLFLWSREETQKQMEMRLLGRGQHKLCHHGYHINVLAFVDDPYRL